MMDAAAPEHRHGFHTAGNHPIGVFEATLGLVAWFYAPEFVRWVLEQAIPGLVDFGEAGSTTALAWRVCMWVSLTAALLLWVGWARRLRLTVIGVGRPVWTRDAPVVVRLGLLAGGMFALLLGGLLVAASVEPAWFGAKPGQSAFDAVIGRFGTGEAGWLALLNICLIAPVIEEVWFRGWLFPVLRSWLPKWVAVVGSAMVFALAHTGSPLEHFPLSQLIGGVVFALAYDRTGNLTAPVVLHVLGNTSLQVLTVMGR
jgi:membrane protease YdiL (CAAX protease family)